MSSRRFGSQSLVRLLGHWQESGSRMPLWRQLAEALRLLLAGAIVLNALATGMYIGAGFGPGPRDGLMTGLHARTGWSLRGIRTAIELSVLLIGWMMGGKFGVGTVLYAITIGPLIQLCLPWFHQSAARKALAKPGEAIS